MKANEFIKNHGVGEAKRVLQDARGCTGVKLWGRYEFSTDELNQLIEAHEIIKLFKSLDHAKAEVQACEQSKHSEILVKLDVGVGYIWLSRVKQAILDVESCQ